MSSGRIESLEHLSQMMSRGGSRIAGNPLSSKAAKPPLATGQGDQSQKRARRDYKADLIQQLTFRGIHVEPEFKIFPNRRFKADWRVIDAKVLIEYEGGLFHAGKMGHNSVAGILRDIVKANLAQIDGWIVVRVAPNHVDSGEALIWIEAAIEESTRPRY